MSVYMCACRCSVPPTYFEVVMEEMIKKTVILIFKFMMFIVTLYISS